MKALLTYGKLLLCLSALCTFFLLSACSQAQTGSGSTYSGTTTTTATTTTTNAPTATTAANTGSAGGTGGTASSSTSSKFTYASVEITIVSVEQKSTYTDDTDTSSPLHLRINTKENNPTNNTVYLSYSDSLRLILANGQSVAPNTGKDVSSIDANIVRDSWIDFPIAGQQDLSKLTLQVGKTTEHQMSIPLAGNPDLSKYQLKTITPGNTFKYAGLDWTVTQETASLSSEGIQAGTGNRFITISLSVSNSSADTVYAGISDNFRLSGAGVTMSPTDTTLPSSFAAGTSGTKGNINFQMPAGATDLTLDMKVTSDFTTAASIKFQIPA